MSLKNGTINPLNVHNLRRLTFCPPHFTCLKTTADYSNQKTIVDWIYENFEGRFFVGEENELNGKSMTAQMVIGFELPTESTYFGLMLPSIIQN